MPKYIDADKINAKLMDEYYGMISDESMKVYKIMQMLDNAPAADVEEVRHGKWIPDKKREGVVICSECKRGECCDWFRYKYCYTCGALMDLEDK